MKTLTMEEFGQVVARVMKTLPPEFEPYLHNVVVEVLEEPTREMLRSVDISGEEIEAGETIYGLFAPIDLPSAWSGTAVDIEDVPHRLYIFKGPLERDFPNRLRMLIEIRKTVIHELAHHFHFTDRDLERFDALPNPFRRPDKVPRRFTVARLLLPVLGLFCLVVGVVSLFREEGISGQAPFWFLGAIAALGLGGIHNALGDLAFSTRVLLGDIVECLDAMLDEGEEEDEDEDAEPEEKPGEESAPRE